MNKNKILTLLIASGFLSGCFDSVGEPSKEVVEQAIKSCKNVGGVFELKFHRFTCKYNDNDITTHVEKFPTLNP